MVIDQISPVRNYRHQFSRFLRTSSCVDLVQDVESKLRREIGRQRRKLEALRSDRNDDRGDSQDYNQGCLH